MEILSELPKELKWNVLKFLRHPTAEIMREPIELYNTFRFFGELRNPNMTFVEFALPTTIDFDRYCDCCAELWEDCSCWWSNCGEEYKECRASWYRT